MMIRDNSDMESENDRSDCEGMPPLKDSDGDELVQICVLLSMLNHIDCNG
jgi:hypothetical protein